MVNSTQAAQGRATRQRRRAIAVWLCVGLAVVTGLGLAVWHALGQADKISHGSDLVFLREELVAQAQREGKYPRDLRQAIRAAGQDRYLDAADMLYYAAGRPYDPEGTQLLFCEWRPRRYGFERGGYDVYQHTQYFVPVYGNTD